MPPVRFRWGDIQKYLPSTQLEYPPWGQPSDDFEFDGCSHAPDKSLWDGDCFLPACGVHDHEYRTARVIVLDEQLREGGYLEGTVCASRHFVIDDRGEVAFEAGAGTEPARRAADDRFLHNLRRCGASSYEAGAYYRRVRFYGIKHYTYRPGARPGFLRQAGIFIVRFFQGW